MDDSDNKGRRVTDKSVLDVAHQAVRLEELNGRQNLLSLQITQGLNATRTAIEGTQSEVHKLVGAVEKLAAFQTDHASNKDALDMLRRQIDLVSTRMEQLFTDQARVQDRKWDAYAVDRDQRWREHEADNENTARDLRKEMTDIKDIEVRKLREKLIRWTGVGFGFGLVAVMIVSGFLYHLNYRFNENDATTTKLQAQAAVGVRELAEIKLYLARGGRVPAQLFIDETKETESDD